MTILKLGEKCAVVVSEVAGWSVYNTAGSGCYEEWCTIVMLKGKHSVDVKGDHREALEKALSAPQWPVFIGTDQRTYRGDGTDASDPTKVVI